MIKNLMIKLINYPKMLIGKQSVHDNSILEGGGHVLGPSTRITLCDGAKKDNVVFKAGTWILGKIMVSHNGKVIMHEHSKIDATTQILCVNRVEIGAYTAIALNTTICDNNNHPINPKYRMFMRCTPVEHDARTWKYSDNAPIIIGSNCWIGTNVRIQKGVTIGDNSIIAACSVVTKSIPANCIAAGNPAKIVKRDIDKIPAPMDCPSYNEYCLHNNI